MKEYAIVGAGRVRPFQITGGLAEGYASGSIVFSFVDVVSAHGDWQRKTGHILGCYIRPETLSYGWPDGLEIHAATEPGWILSGSFNPMYDAALADEDAWGRLLSLAAFLGNRLRQTRVYVSFAGEMRILQAAGESTPREVI